MHDVRTERNRKFIRCKLYSIYPIIFNNTQYWSHEANIYAQVSDKNMLDELSKTIRITLPPFLPN